MTTHYIKLWHKSLDRYVPVAKLLRIDLRKVLTFEGNPNPNIMEFLHPASVIFFAFLDAFGIDAEVVDKAK